MAPLGLIILFILVVNSYSHRQVAFDEAVDQSVPPSMNQKPQYSNEEFSKADFSDYSNFIKKEDKKDTSDQPATTRNLKLKQQISYKPIFTVDNLGYNFIGEEDKKFISEEDKSFISEEDRSSISEKDGSFTSEEDKNFIREEDKNFIREEDKNFIREDKNSIHEEDKNDKTDLSITTNSVKEQQISSQPILTTDGPDHNFINKENQKEKIEKSKKQKQRISYEPIFTTDSQNYNLLSKEDKKDTKPSWGSTVRKLLFKNKKENYKKLHKSDEEENDDVAKDNAKGNKEWDFSNNSFTPSETGDSDSGSTKSSQSWSKLLKQIWSESSSPSGPLSRSSSSSSSTSEMDSVINKLLDDYDGKDEKVVGPGVEPTAEGEELPKKPEVFVKNFSLCSEVYANIQELDVFSDGKAPTCIFACLYYKIKHSVFEIRPEGRCGYLSSHGPGVDRAPITEFACICSRGKKKKHRFKILQLERSLYFVHNSQFGLFHPLGTLEEIFDYVEGHFRQYLKDFLKDKRGIDWKGMYEYLRDLRWNRQDSDDRPVGQYLSESLKEEVDDIKFFWTVGIRTFLLRVGNNRKQLW